MERRKPATELKLVSQGNEFHALTTCSLKKTRPCTSVSTYFKEFGVLVDQLEPNKICSCQGLSEIMDYSHTYVQQEAQLSLRDRAI